MKDLENGSFSSLTDDELRDKIRLIHDGFEIRAPILPAGTIFYRAIKVYERPTHKSRVSYPPADAAKGSGRLNKAGEMMFYGAFSLFTCLHECGWQIGEFFAVSGWRTTAQMTLNHLGYSKPTFAANKSTRDLPFFAYIKQDSIRNILIREWQGRVFTQPVPRGQEHLYRLPIALKDFALQKMNQIDPTLPICSQG